MYQWHSGSHSNGDFFAGHGILYCQSSGRTGTQRGVALIRGSFREVSGISDLGSTFTQQPQFTRACMCREHDDYIAQQ